MFSILPAIFDRRATIPPISICFNGTLSYSDLVPYGISIVAIFRTLFLLDLGYSGIDTGLKI
jgi:hypothetical protein